MAKRDDKKGPHVYDVTSSDDRTPLLGEQRQKKRKDSVVAAAEAQARKKEGHRSKMLILSFLSMVFVGLGNKIFQKLQTGPMNNYPYFLSLLTTFYYVPISALYILPMVKWGKQITQEQLDIPWYKFGVMGLLDSIAGVMQSFAANELFGGYLILLSQSAIPVSMALTWAILKKRYKMYHYAGALCVLVGLAVVLVPPFINPRPGQQSHNIGLWSAVMVVSCVPMTLSSIYKEKALGEIELDVVYMNGAIAVYQLFMTILLAVPALYAQRTPTPVDQLPSNLWAGLKCYCGYNTAANDHCELAPLFVNIYMIFNLLYNVNIILILKYGSSNLLWMALTIMVPAGDMVFSLPFIPQRQSMQWSDVVGLVVIMGGLITYRFYDPLERFCRTYYHRLVLKQPGWIHPAKLAEMEEGSEGDDESVYASTTFARLPIGMSTADHVYAEPDRILHRRGETGIRRHYFSRLGIDARPQRSEAQTAAAWQHFDRSMRYGNLGLDGDGSGQASSSTIPVPSAPPAGDNSNDDDTLEHALPPPSGSGSIN